MTSAGVTDGLREQNMCLRVLTPVYPRGLTSRAGKQEGRQGREARDGKGKAGED